MRLQVARRRFPIFLGLMLACAAFQACGGSDSSPVLDSDAGDASVHAIDATPDDDASAACTVLAAGRDTSCEADVDCVLVPVGGAYCPGCGDEAQEGDLVCPEVALNASAAMIYSQAIDAALAMSTQRRPDGSFCSTDGCLSRDGVARCYRGTCIKDDDGGN